MLSKDGLAEKYIYENKWIWSVWLKEQKRPDLKYSYFNHIEYVEDETKRSEIEGTLAKLLYEYHTHMSVNTSLLAHLSYPLLASVLNDSFDQRPKAERTRLGNFIEILACELAKRYSYDIPVLRLQYNPNPDQSMKGDDILGFRIGNERGQDVVLTGEGKFRSTFETLAVKEAYDGLKAKIHSGPISMEFIAAILSRQGDEVKAAKIVQSRKQIVQGDPKIVQKYLLFLGTVGQPKDPFKVLQELGTELLPNLIAVNVVFKNGLQGWLDQVYNQEYRY